MNHIARVLLVLILVSLVAGCTEGSGQSADIKMIKAAPYWRGIGVTKPDFRIDMVSVGATVLIEFREGGCSGMMTAIQTHAAEHGYEAERDFLLARVKGEMVLDHLYYTQSATQPGCEVVIYDPAQGKRLGEAPKSRLVHICYEGGSSNSPCAGFVPSDSRLYSRVATTK